MNWKSLAQRAVRVGVRQGIGYMRRSGKDTSALRAVDSLLRNGDGTSTDSHRSRRRGGSPHDDAEPRTAGGARGGRTGADQRAEHDRSRRAARPKPAQRFPKRPDGGYPGDFRGPIKPVYAPDLDGSPDPGEVVWGWVPFEEDHSRGKDRPILLIGRDGGWLLGLMLTSRDNVPGGVGDTHADEHGTPYVNIGTGDWDSQSRPSEVRLDRIIRIEPSAVRREGAIMPMDRFSTVVDSVRAE